MTVMMMTVIAHTVLTIAMAVKQPWQSQLASVAVSTSQVFDVDNEVLRLGMLRLSEKGTQKCLLTNVVQAFGFRLLQVTIALCENIPQRLDSTHKMSIKAIVTRYTKVY